MYSFLFTRINKSLSKMSIKIYSPESAVGWNFFLVTSWIAFIIRLFGLGGGLSCVSLCFSIDKADHLFMCLKMFIFKLAL